MAEMSTYRLTLTDQSTSTEDYDVDYNGSTITAKTCKGLLYALNLTNSNYIIKLHPQDERGFYFQDDDELKTGLNGAINVASNNTVMIDSDNFSNPKPEYIIIQGLQITAGNFLTITENSSETVNFENIYFKDCVHTMTTNSQATFLCPNPTGPSPELSGTFKECKFSIHIRQQDKSNKIVAGGNWDSCSFYVEFSDLTGDSYASDGIFYPTSLNLCSIIVKRASIIGCVDNLGTARHFNLIENCNNSSFDLHFKKINTTIEDSNPYSSIEIGSINNCFISIKSDEWGIGGRGQIQFKSPPIGVNIINTGNAGETNTPTINMNNSNGAVKGLTETECKSQETLGNYGFFVNTVNNS